ncbi:MAG TPA: hypothetical protein VFI95_24165, partial [Terriglobales bacterium]|nr:hypothetical protein [Terriglobales bacterium]
LPRWVRGHGGYALTLPGALRKFKPRELTIQVPENNCRGKLVPRYSQPTFLAAFANAPQYGGGMRIAPEAKLDDGRLDVCLVKDINKLKLFSLFPTVYFGRHTTIPQVDYFQATRVRVDTEIPVDVYADGEYVCRTPIEVTVADKAITVIVPDRSPKN